MSQASGYTVSGDLLAREDFRAACAARDFRQVFHLMQKYDGASQDRICSPVEGFSQSRVSKILRGADRISGLDLIERIVDALHIPGEYFGLVPREWEQVNAAPAVVDAAPTAVQPETLSTIHRSPAVLVNGSALRHSARTGLALAPALAEAGERVAGAVRIERPVGLRPHIERAFEQDAVTIDFTGFSGETLAGALSEPLDKVRSGELTPSSIRVRVLVPDTGRPWAFPCRMEDLADEPAFRQRAAGIVDRSLSTIIDAVGELQDLGAVTEAVAEVRVHGMSPQFKLYVINGQDAFYGFYPVTEHMVKTRGSVHAMYDVMGKDSVLFHHSDDGDPASPAAQYVAQSRLWFESVWGSVAREYDRD
jgi:hypothetical protein